MTEPENVENWLQRADVYRQLEMPDKRIKDLEHVVSISPKDMAAWRSLGDALAARGDWTAASKALAQALEFGEKDYYWKVASAFASAAAGDQERYRNACTALINSPKIDDVFGRLWICLACTAQEHSIDDYAVLQGIAEGKSQLKGSLAVAFRAMQIPIQGMIRVRSGNFAEGIKELRSAKLVLRGAAATFPNEQAALRLGKAAIELLLARAYLGVDDRINAESALKDVTASLESVDPKGRIPMGPPWAVSAISRVIATEAEELRQRMGGDR